MLACTETFEFGPFRLQPDRRLLLADDVPVPINARAFDILEFLVRNRHRVVGRDEIIAHVWQGMTVGENNLSVQMSTLRRMLSSRTAGAMMIANIPGRGYRFVTDVSVHTGLEPDPGSHLDQDAAALPGSAATCARSSEQAPRAYRRRRSLRLLGPALVIVFLVLLIRVCLDMRNISDAPASMFDPRLSIVVAPLQFDHAGPGTADLARAYTDEIVEHLGLYEDMTVFVQDPARPLGGRPHFLLTGSIHQTGEELIVTITVSEASTARRVSGHAEPSTATASTAARDALAMEMVRVVRPDLIKWEQDHRRTGMRDALDFFIDAKVASHPLNGPKELATSLELAETAVRMRPDFRPARALLSYLLTQEMLWSDLRTGDASGTRGLAMIGSVLHESPDNLLYITNYVYALSALERLDEARFAAERGLRIEKGYYKLNQSLGEIYLQKNDLKRAEELISPQRAGTTDDRPANLAFAQGDHAGALLAVRSVMGSAPATYETCFTRLMEIAILADGGDQPGAARAFSALPADFPEALMHLSALRQAYYALPDQAWARFKTGLAAAGMRP